MVKINFKKYIFIYVFACFLFVVETNNFVSDVWIELAVLVLSKT
jgi:hypothetical protein